MINSKDEALSSLPTVPIQENDKVYPARVVLNSIIANQVYLLKNTNDVDSSKILGKTDNWNTLEPQTTFRFNGMGIGAPDKNILTTDQGIVITFGSNSEPNPTVMQVVITSAGLAYRVIGQYWSYLGHQVPSNIDADHLIDREKLKKILKKQLTKYVTNLTYTQDSENTSNAINKGNKDISSLSSNLSTFSSSTNTSFQSIDNRDSSQVSSLNGNIYNNKVRINDTYDSISTNDSNISSIAESMNGIQNANGSYFGGVFGENGLSEEVSNNTMRLNSSNDSMESMNGSIRNLQIGQSAMTRGYEDIGGQLQSVVDKSSAEGLPVSVYANSSNISSLKNSLAPIAMENMQELNSIATTTFTGSYGTVDVLSSEALSASSNPSNFSPIISNVYLTKGVPYEFTANVAEQNENVSTSPNVNTYEDVTGTIGFEKHDEDGIEYQLLDNQSNNYPVPSGYYTYLSTFLTSKVSNVDWLSNPNVANSNKYVKITYPTTNVDIDTQLHDHLVDIIFIPTSDEKLNIVSVPAKTDLKPPVYKNIRLIEHQPINQKYNTNSLLSATATSMSDIANQFQQETSINNNNIILNNEIANTALSGASQATSYLDSAPRISLSPTYSYANSCSTQDPSHIFLYPQYDNDKEEKAIDWCLTEITPQKVKVYGNWSANTPENVLVNQVKNLTAGIIGTIESVENMMGGAVADPQNPDNIQDWTVTNYLNWHLTSDYDTSSILNYLNSTLKREPNQEWDGWEAYLGLHAGQEDCATWLFNQLQNGAEDSTYYADKVRSLLY